MPKAFIVTRIKKYLFLPGKKSLPLAFLLFLVLHGAGIAQQIPSKVTLTLDDAIQIALKNNYDILMGSQDTKKADEQINEAYANAYPSVSFNGQYMRNIELPVMFIPPNSAFNPTNETQTFELGSKNSYSATITVGQTIYNQKVNTAIKIADEYASYSRTALKASRQQVILAVKKAFLDILLMEELTKVSRQSFELADANYKDVSAMYKQGVASEYDFIRAEVQRANVQPVLTQTENNLQLSKNYLRTLLALGADKEIEIKGTFAFEELPQPMLTEYNTNAVSNSPLVEQLRINESLLDKNMIIERSEYYPTLAAFGQYAWQTQDNTFTFSNYKWAESFSVGLSLSYNIFDGFKRGARIEQVKIDRDKVTLARKKLQDNILLELDQAQRKMTEAKGRIDAQGQSIRQAEKAQAIAESRYKNGVGTQLEIIDTQTALQSARTNYSQAVYDYLTAKAEWEYAVSKEYVENNGR